MDLTKARIVTPAEMTAAQEKAVQVLIEEIGKRSGITLEQSRTGGTGASVVLGAGAYGKAAAGGREELKPPGPEGYAIVSTEDGSGVFVLGADDRGLLYGVGKLLRNLTLRKGGIRLEKPKIPINGLL